MSLILQFLFVVILSSHVAAATGVAVVQSAAPTSNGGTQDFTSSGFGTPTCAMFFGSYGTANGTVVDDAHLAAGFTDFTTSELITVIQEDGLTTTSTDTSASTTGALRALIGTSTDGTGVASTITDGARLTWADAPTSAYLNTAVLFNSDAVANCVVGRITPNATQNGTASVSGLGWQPDVVIAFTPNNTLSIARSSFGIAINDSGVVQRSVGQNSQTGVTTTEVTQVYREDRLTINSFGSSGMATELTSFDSGGFTLTTRDAGGTLYVQYLAFKLASGVQAKLLSCLSPTSTGSHSCTGTGWTPQAGIMLHTEASALATWDTAGENETYGISAFTAAAAFSSAISDDDGVSTSNTTSITDSKPVRLYKNGADFMVATSTGAQSNGWDFNYTTTNGTARYRAVLFLESTAVSSSARPRGAVFLP